MHGLCTVHGKAGEEAAGDCLTTRGGQFAPGHNLLLASSWNHEVRMHDVQVVFIIIIIIIIIIISCIALEQPRCLLCLSLTNSSALCPHLLP